MADQGDLDTQLSTADRAPGGVELSGELQARLDEIGQRARSTPREPFVERPRPWFSLPVRGARRGLALVSLLGVIGVGAAAAAILSTTTVGAPGFCQTAFTNSADIPFPAGYHWWLNWAVLDISSPKVGTTLHELCNSPTSARLAAGGSPGPFVIPLVSQQGQFTRTAVCAWADVWLKATGVGDTATASNAAQQIARALRWPSSQAANPNPVPGPGSKATVLGWFIPLQHAVQSGDTALVTSLFDRRAQTYPGGECTPPISPPVDSDHGTVVPAGA